ncbi:hypothetical protein BDF20DRAFT_915847 [Mycotypha africana]|uniref:uncharacterized protein n=1 Tax=Mycotypha africana TaxID=64632 RepID=UPI0023010E29|nr:uncharacterized protein BDF20DRAFT_915847 [Mycotypha africana]KAI8969954.1 hypothetical protein BDF20DRAFT_915847 [Mycotypha africana]
MNQKDDNLRQIVINKQFNDNKKKNPFSNWDKIRGNVNNYGAFKGSPSSSNVSSPASSHSSIATSFSPHSKKHQSNPFLRSFAGDLINNHGGDMKGCRQNMSLADTTLVAAQAAGMTNFARNFRGIKHHNGAIYATSTAVQQDIYKLERELEKIISQLNSRSRLASFAESASTLVSTSTNAESGLISTHPLGNTYTKRSVFRRSSIADIFHTSTNFVNDLPPLKENIRSGVTRTSHIMNLIMESLKKHKSASRLPLRKEIFAILASAFDRIPLLESECDQALDIFDYIRYRFTQLDAAESFEQLLFSCHLMSAGSINTKIRLLESIEAQIQACRDSAMDLPSSPKAYQSLVYTITTAIAQLTFDDKLTSDNYVKGSNEENDENKVRYGLLKLLDKLADGTLIPPVGAVWTTYHTGSNIPISVAQFCVVESLLKSAMVGDCCQNDPYQGEEKQASANSVERRKDKVIFQELLQRFWIEPEITTNPAYLQIIFLLSELACETFLGATARDLKAENSTVSLLFHLVLEKLSPRKLQKLLTEIHTEETQRKVALSMTNALLALLTIWNMNDDQQERHNSASSVNFTEQPSTPNTYNYNLNEEEHFTVDDKNINFTDTTFQHKVALAIKQFVQIYWNTGYKEFILEATESMLQDATSERVACAYQNLVFNVNQSMGQEISKKTLPSLFKRLLDTHPPAIQPLCDLLYNLSRQFPTTFYKPVIACAASDDESKVTHMMKLIFCLRRYLSGVQFWMHDSEMINVILLSNTGQNRKQQHSTITLSAPSINANTVQSSDSQTKHFTEHEQIKQWGSTTLGQCIIATEFMWAVKELRHKQDDVTRNMEEDEIAKKFLIDLEKRLAVFLTAKEMKTLIPMPLRNILCNIFIDIRFFCNTTHRPGWLTRVIDWATQPVDLQATSAASEIDISLQSTTHHHENRMAVLDLPSLEQISLMYRKIQAIYGALTGEFQFEVDDMFNVGSRNLEIIDESDAQSVEAPRHKRQKYIYTMYPMSRAVLTALTLDPPASVQNVLNNESEDSSKSEDTALKLVKYRFEHISEINQHPFGSIFSLLCAVFSTLSSQEFARLVKPLWDRFMDDKDPKALVPAAFLLMQCGEKIPKLMIETCTHDFYSDDPLQRLSVIHRHAALNAFRFNVLGQEYIPISSRRRPFRGDGGAFSTPFVPTDLGSNRFTLDEPRWMAKLKNASNFPVELKRQIQELGWDDEDNGEEQEALKKVLTPLALLPSLFLEKEEERMNEDDNPGLIRRNGKSADISKLINRRKRASTVQALTVSFLSMVDLLNDDYGGTFNSLHELLEYFLRDDPSHFLRTFLNNLGKFKLERHKDILTRVRFLVSIQSKLPPEFTHILFNYLAGMLKWLVRENRSKDGLILMTLIHPILAELILSTNDLSIRDLRKNKIEHLLISTGRFWFTHEQPAGIFPRYLSDVRTPFTILDIPQEIFSVAVLRISHIQFLTNYLIRYPREVYAVKKMLQDYEPLPIPSVKESTRWATQEDYFPDIAQRSNQNTAADKICVETAKRQSSQSTIDIEMLSGVRARVWLRFIDILLTGLNKNYNDREELEQILKGINTIIANHSYDFNIVGQALILYTRVVTRFKRLFISNRGYPTFLPALFKVYCEVIRFPQIRSAIIFAWCRFYAVHGESFVFQMLGALVPLILNAYHKSEELGSWMSDNFFGLMQALHDPPYPGSTSDVIGLQLQVELDDHERSVQERIDAASNPMVMPLSTGILKPLARSMTMPIVANYVANFGNFSFDLRNFIKLFLTIIAYDPGSLRAEQFVIIFRRLLPQFQEVAGLRSLLDEGVAALVDVFNKFGKHAKVTLSNASTATHQSSSGGYQGVMPETDTPRAEAAQHAYGKQWQQNDRLTIRLEFVRLVQTYLKLDGSLNEVCHEKMASIIRNIMRDYGNFKNLTLKTDWIKEYLVNTVPSMAALRNFAKPLKKLLSQIFLQYRSQYKTVDASDLYDGIAIMIELGQEKSMNMYDVAAVVNEKFVTFGLSIAARSVTNRVDKEEHNRFCNSLVRVILAVTEHSSLDMLSTIEQQVATPCLMIDILIPICLKYNRNEGYANISKTSRGKHDSLSNWMRLLNYVTAACSQASLLKMKSNGFSLSHFAANMSHGATQMDANSNDYSDIKDPKQTPLSIALLFSLSFVALKIILVRADADLVRLKGAWASIAYFIKNALIFGQSLKFLKPKSGRSSPIIPTTPLAGALSPAIPAFAGGASPLMGNWTAATPSTENRNAFSIDASFGVSTIYDFTTWRFMEFILYYRCPLYIYLKGFIYEKATQLKVMNNNQTIYTPSPSPRTSMNPPTSANIQRGAQGSSKQWGRSSENDLTSSNQSSLQSSPFGIIPQLNIEHIDAEETELDGLGLKSSNNSSKAQLSPGLHPATSFSSSVNNDASNSHTDGVTGVAATERTSSGSHITLPPSPVKYKHSFETTYSSSKSVPAQKSLNTSNADGAFSSTVLHVLHAESMTSIVQIQLSMGIKPALPWMAAKKQFMKPWTKREAIRHLTNEQRLLLQLFEETLVASPFAKFHSNPNTSTSNINSSAAPNNESFIKTIGRLKKF